MSDLRRYTRDKLKSRSTYVVAAVVGTFINLYGHFLVPVLRGESRPLDRFLLELGAAPIIVGSSIVLAYLFPMCVGVYSAVATRFQTRGAERRSWFPDHKPDPVFRAALDGSIADSGKGTSAFFERFGIRTAQDILGAANWEKIVGHDGPNDEPLTIDFEPAQQTYRVVHAPAPNGDINVYMTRS